LWCLGQGSINDALVNAVIIKHKTLDKICEDDYGRQNQVTYIRITVFT